MEGKCRDAFRPLDARKPSKKEKGWDALGDAKEGMRSEDDAKRKSSHVENCGGSMRLVELDAKKRE